jgi:hypothetical protein
VATRRKSRRVTIDANKVWEDYFVSKEETKRSMGDQSNEDKGDSNNEGNCDKPPLSCTG